MQEKTFLRLAPESPFRRFSRNSSFLSTDERDAIQKKTFTKWVNKHLKKVIHDSLLPADFLSMLCLLALLFVCRAVLFEWSLVVVIARANPLASQNLNRLRENPNHRRDKRSEKEFRCSESGSVIIYGVSAASTHENTQPRRSLIHEKK